VEIRNLWSQAQPGEAASALTLAPREHRSSAKPDPNYRALTFAAHSGPAL